MYKSIVNASKSIKTLEDHMIMFYTNQKRNSETVLKNQYKIKKKQYENLKKLKEIVGISKVKLLNKNFRIQEFGKLLDENWKLKKKINRLSSNNLIDKYYNQAINSRIMVVNYLGQVMVDFYYSLQANHLKKIANKLKKLKKCILNLIIQELNYLF